MKDRTEEAIERAERRKRQQSEKKKQESIITKSACECLSTDSGKIFLRYLMNECGFLEPSVIVDHKTGEVKKESTVYNEAKRDVYLRVRRLLKSRPDVLFDVEMKDLKE